MTYRVARVSLIVACMAATQVGSLGQRTNGAGLKVSGTAAPDTPSIPGKPLETRPAFGEGQRPAFASQTRAIAVLTKTPIEERIVAGNLNQPWGMAFLPGGKLLITEKPGAMRIFDMASGKLERAVARVPAVTYGGDAGLLDVLADPEFATNRTIYFTYVEPRSPEYRVMNGTTGVTGSQQDSGIVVARAKLSADEAELQDVTTIFRVEPSVPQTAHYGSRLLFSKEGYLYVTLGERFFYPTRGEAQSLFSYMGKILRITTDGKPAPGNPFAGEQDQEDHLLAEIWSLGHRNPQGLAINPLNGDLWESEHGPQGGDELNVIQPGKNYGWPVIAYGTNYDGSRIDGTLPEKNGFWPGRKPELKGNGPGSTAMEGMEQPVYYWDPTIAPSGITFYTGKLIPEWKNNLFVAALAGNHLARLVLDGNRVVGEERLLLDQHQRVRDVQEGPDGALWVITDEPNGRLIRIGPKS